MVETTSAQAPPHHPSDGQPPHSPPASPNCDLAPDDDEESPTDIPIDWEPLKSHPYIGDLYKVPSHRLVPADAVGQVYVLVATLNKETFRKLQNMESTFVAPTTASDIPEFFHCLDPLTDEGVILRERGGNGSEDRWLTYCNGPNNYGSDLLARAQKVTTDITGPKDAVEPGPKGTAFERQGRAIRLATGPRCYSLGVTDQTQRSLEGPAAGGKVFNHYMAEPALQTHTDILSLGAELAVHGIKRFEPDIYAKHAVQSDLVNAPHVGHDSNVMFARAQLNLASPNDKDCEDVDHPFEVGESSSDESDGSPSEDDQLPAPLPQPQMSDEDSLSDRDSSRHASFNTRRSKRLRKDSNQPSTSTKRRRLQDSTSRGGGGKGGGVRETPAKPAKKGLAKSLGRFGAPHNDPRDSPTTKSALTSLSPPCADVEPDYFLIVEIGIAWRIRGYTTTFFSGLYLHTGMSPGYIASGKEEGSAEHVRINLVLYPVRAQLEGSSSQALFALPKPVINNIAVVTQEMRKPWATTTANVFCNSTTLSTDGIAYMDPESLLRQVSRSIYHYSLAILQQVPVQLLPRIDPEMFLQSISFRIGNERVAADANWTYGPCWSGEDVTPGIKPAYSDGHLPTTPEAWAALFNSDTPTHIPFGNQNIPRAVDEWEALRREVGSTIPYWALKEQKASADQEKAAANGQRKGKKKVVEPIDINMAFARGRPTSKISTSRRKPCVRKSTHDRRELEEDLNGGNEGGRRRGQDHARRNENNAGDGVNANIANIPGQVGEGGGDEGGINGEDEQGTDGLGNGDFIGGSALVPGRGQSAMMETDPENPEPNTVATSVYTQNMWMRRSEPEQLSALAPTASYPLPLETVSCSEFIECLSPQQLQYDLDSKLRLTSQLSPDHPSNLDDCLPRPDASIKALTASYHSLLTLDVHVQLMRNVIHFNVMLINVMVCEWISDTIRGLLEPDSPFDRLYQHVQLWVETQTAQGAVLHPSDYFPDMGFDAESAEEVDLRQFYPRTKRYALAAHHLAIRVVLRWIHWPISSYRVSMHRAHFTRLLLDHVDASVLWLEGTYHAWTNLDKVVDAPVTVESLSRWAVSVLAPHNICLGCSEEKVLLQRINLLMTSRALRSTIYNSSVQASLVSVEESVGRVHTLCSDDLFSATDAIIDKLRLDRYYCKLYALLPLTSPPYLGIAHIVKVVEDQPFSEWIKFVQYVAEDADKRLPFRDLAPSRQRILSSSSIFSSPYQEPHLRTKEGFFSALIYRGVTHNTRFLLSEEYPGVFYDLDHWLSVYTPLQPLHPQQYFCNMQAYFTACSSRSVENISKYWRAVQRSELTDWLTGHNVQFGTVYRLLLKATIPSGIKSKSRHRIKAFPGMGYLSIYLLCADYAAAGVIAMPTFDELATVLLDVSGGALKGLRNLGFHCESVEKTSAALSAVDRVLRDLFRDTELAQMNYNLLTLEHSLCKDGVLEGSVFNALYGRFVKLHGSAEHRWY
ncbi:hypothetical protein E1B28_000052 [Marasmius oreades]|uniref:Uncharacterized protein n=1 Tax=Marasmius oreades TaxID=181124 RepID=A0A9P7V0J9_9AGAR|nr:uncharacterized protein E1B28_000052 [Marasmius oreades]KAG7098078.1 hypothetical protein E1B28_000052 [Marasmius oreades]